MEKKGVDTARGTAGGRKEEAPETAEVRDASTRRREWCHIFIGGFGGV
jgi:hypothetical protein